MNREKKFRAKSLDGFWFYWKLNDPIDMATLGIDWKTLGQCTGLIDVERKDIYEGDIIEFSNVPGIKDGVGKVIWDCFKFNIEINETDIEELYNFDSWNTKIIGDIYDNPELLK